MITMKRTFSIILAVFMLLSAIPFTASAADPIALKASNVTVWPTATGEMYYGQIVGEHITLSGGKVEYNGTEVPGSFVHYKDDFRPLNASDAYKANLKFVPDDSSAYTGFNKLMSADVTFVVKKTTPVWVDEADLPVATSVKSGQTLSESTISGGTMKNPYNESETGVQAAAWTWSNPDTVLTESGEYEAYYAANSKSYEIVKRNIYVEVEQDVFLTEVSVVPTIEEFTYDSDITWADISLLGGVAVVSGTDTQVEGEFAISDTWKARVPSAGSYEITVIFTPCDTEKYTSAEVKVPVTVNKSAIKFVDENGNEIVPEIELGYNTKDLQYNLSEIKNLLKPYANCGEENFYCNWQDLENKDLPYRKDYLEVNTTKEYIIRGLSYDSDNYAPAMLTFKLKVVPRKLTATVRYTGNSISVDTTKPLTDKLYGTFEYYANGEKVGTSQITTTTDATGLKWKPEKSGVYDITVKFVPDEKDVYYFDDTTVEDMEIICAWGVTVENGTVKVSNSYKENGSFKYGADVSVQSKTNASFSHWIVTDTKGNEIEIEGFDKNKSGNTFKMPDFSVNFKAIDLTQRKITCVNCFVKNAVGSADAPIRYKGQKVSIGIDEAALPLEKFAGWEITDSNGNAYMPEGLTEEALASTNIEFTMPDFDITVKAKNVDDEKGDGFFAQVKAFFENLFNGETECPVLKWIIKVFNVIVNFFTGLFVK